MFCLDGHILVCMFIQEQEARQSMSGCLGTLIFTLFYHEFKIITLNWSVSPVAFRVNHSNHRYGFDSTGHAITSRPCKLDPRG